jgi:hypothetical protein
MTNGAEIYSLKDQVRMKLVAFPERYYQLKTLEQNKSKDKLWLMALMYALITLFVPKTVF